MQFNSTAKQDEFVARILKFKRNGFFLDIGSHASIVANNSYFFDNTLDWKGICVELDSNLSSSYSTRKNTTLINKDATQIDYKELLASNDFPTEIDYLSLDVDTASLDVLKKLPFDKYQFRVITIEHDAYIYGDKYRQPQRDILLDAGYFLICGDVYVEQEGYYGKEFPFEDWWINRSVLLDEVLKIKSNNCLPSQIIEKFNK